MIFIITQRKPKYQDTRIMVFTLLFMILVSLFMIHPVYAVVDPISVSNNRFGIHLIQATPDESSPAAELVNNNGDWGYITVLVESKDRSHEKWQEFFNDLRRRHLIPLVRLATQPEGNFWKLPYEGEEIAWADFLDALNWPTKNRYIIVYNEPNHATEWGNKVDASSYAKTLDKTITALKNKNQDFFVLNAGFDASAPSQPPNYENELFFIKQMNEAVPGIFNKLDGWVSHSYPNPGFVGSPDDFGRGTVRTYIWELQQLRNFGVGNNFPVFITETGWEHAEGLNLNSRLPNADIVAKYYQQAFDNAWNSANIVAITPFLLNYQEAPFDHFSFKKITGEKQNVKILGVQFPEYYPMYETVRDMPKNDGKPVQENKAQLTDGEIYSSIVSGQSYAISLTFKNTGQSIWNDSLSQDQVSLIATKGAWELGISDVQIPKDIKVEPGQEYTFRIQLKAPKTGTFRVSLNFYNGNKRFGFTKENSPTVYSENLEFTTVVKSPVILKIKSGLLWKNDFSGNYILSVKGATGESLQNIVLDKNGLSSEIEAKYLLPDYPFDFTLERQYYLPSQIRQTVRTGVNLLDFNKLKPDIRLAIFNPNELWKLLPFSN